MRADREKFVAGFDGHDSMRNKAKKEFGHEMRASNMKVPKGRLSKGTGETRLYKKGGEVKPKKYGWGGMALDAMSPALGATNILANKAGIKTGLKKGGKAGCRKKYDLGGNVQGRSTPMLIAQNPMARNMPVASNPNAQNPVFKRGGSPKNKKSCKCYSEGGNVYEREMVGERPSRKAPHFNYEFDMKGEHGRKAKYAAGGVAKIRHKQATKNGEPLKHRRVTRGV